MNKKIAVMLFAFIISAEMRAQTALSGDFDGDGKTDKMNLIENADGYKITYSLSLLNKTFSSKVITNGGDTKSLSMTKNVVVLSCQFMRGDNVFKFRYDTKLKQMKLIGYDNNQYGNAVNDGSGSSSYNLSTGQYVANWKHYDQKKGELIALPKSSKKYPIKNYTLNNFSDAMIDQLYKVGNELLPAEMR